MISNLIYLIPKKLLPRGDGGVASLFKLQPPALVAVRVRDTSSHVLATFVNPMVKGAPLHQVVDHQNSFSFWDRYVLSYPQEPRLSNSEEMEKQEIALAIGECEDFLKRLEEEERSIERQLQKLGLMPMESAGFFASLNLSTVTRIGKRGTKTSRPSNDAVGTLYGALNSLKRERAQVKDRLHTHKANLIAFHINRLPPEMWLEIFIHLLPPDEFCSWRGLMNVRYASMVCRKWRAVAIGTPILWTSISLQVFEDQLGRQGEILRTIIERSKDLPLSLELAWPLPLVQHNSASINERLVRLFEQHFAPVLLPSIPRWRAFSLTSPGHFSGYILNRPMNALSSLSLSTLSGETVVLPRHFPSLRSASFSSVHHEMGVFPWSQLTKLNITGTLYLASVVQILELCPNVRESRVHIAHGPYHPIPSSLRHPRMRSFSFRHREPASVILAPFELPNLVNLQIDIPPNENKEFIPCAMDGISTLVVNSGCKLKSLRVTGYIVKPEDVDACIQRIPTLTFLELHRDLGGKDLVTSEKKAVLKGRI